MHKIRKYLKTDCESESDFVERVNIGVNTYNNVIDKIFTVLNNDPFALDDTFNKSVNDMLKDKYQKQLNE